MKYVDLHLHTTASDGSLSPAELVAMAKRAGYAAIAITDHDNTGGLPEAAAAGARLGVEVVPGIELSTEYAGLEVHILGYFIDPGAESLSDLLETALLHREERNTRICQVLQAAGVDVSMEELRETFPGAVLGRPHIGQVMVKKGYVGDVKQAFREYLGKGAKCYVPKVNMPMERAIRRISDAGGLPVLAHPYQYELEDAGLRTLIETAKGYGVVGMECVYSKYDEAQTAALLALCEEYGLAPTGGSDFHGASKPNISVGTTKAPYAYLEGLKELKQSR